MKTAELIKSLNGRVDRFIGNADERLKAVELGLERGIISPAPGVGSQAGKQLSLAKLFVGMSGQGWNNAKDEQEQFEIMRKTKTAYEGQKRAMDSSQDSKGGYIIAPRFEAELIELIRTMTYFEHVQATTLTGLAQSPVLIPRLKTGVSVSWVGPNAAAASSDEAFEQIALTPKKLKGLAKLDNSLLVRSTPAAEQIIREDFSRAIGEEISIKSINGSGSSNEPLGIINFAGVTDFNLGTNGGDPTFVNLMKIRGKLNGNNIPDDGTRAWVFHSNTLDQVGTQLDGNNRPVFESLFSWRGETAPPARSLLGSPWYIENGLATNVTKGTGTNLSTLIYGRFRDLLVGMWRGMELAVSGEAGTSWENDQTWIRIIQEIDFASRHPLSFVFTDEVKTINS